MKYEFKTNLDKSEYDNFVTNFPGSSFMQQAAWANVKSAWEHDLVGMYENKKLVATALILKRPLFLGKRLFYIPRGFVVDYDNEQRVDNFIKELKNYAKKNGAIDVKIDPFMCFSEENVQTITKGKQMDICKSFVNHTQQTHMLLKRCGFMHAGYKKEVNAYIQPRYTMAIPLKDKDGKPLEKEALKRSFPKNTRNYIGTYQEQRGVSFSYSKNVNDVEKLISVLECTEKRQHIALRSKSYFENLMKNFPNSSVLFFATVNLDKYIEFLKKDMLENEEKKEFCEKQINEAKRLKVKYGNEPLAGATIVLMPTCSSGTKVASFLYAGTNTEILPSLKITNGLMFYRLCYALDNNCDYCDLGGVDGSLKDHLSTFKSKFNPSVLELVGEYDLVINKTLFWLFNKAMDTLKFIRSKR